MIKAALSQSVSPKPAHKTETKISLKALFPVNLLLTQASELTEKCSELANGNTLISFQPPQMPHLEDNESFYENIAAGQTLEECLEKQLPFIPEAAAVERSPELWSALLDSRGYLNCTVEEAAAFLGTSPILTQKALEAVRENIEPAGLFAENLKASLLLQLKRAGEEGSEGWELLLEGESFLTEGRLTQFAEQKGWSSGQLTQALRLLKSLDPAPGQAFSSAHYIMPEIEFRISGNEVTPRLLLENMPRVTNSFGEYEIPPAALLEEQWLAGEWRSAKRTLKLLGLRYRTLLRVAILLAQRQKAYICGEKTFPEPLTYAAAASLLNMGTSTLFRIAAHCWCSCRGRSLPLKGYFSRGAGARPELTVKELRSEIAALAAEGKNARETAAQLGIPIRTASYHRAKLKALL